MKIGVIGFLAVSAISSFAQPVQESHPSWYYEVGTMTVTVHYHYDKKETSYVLSRSAGFTTSTCDFIVPFSAVEIIESEQSHPSGNKTIEVTIGGKIHSATLRTHGYYPLGLNLACLELLPAADENMLEIVPLKIADGGNQEFTYHGAILGSPTLGYPLMNKSHEVVGMYIDPETFISSRDINRFTRLLVVGTPHLWPELRHR